MTTPISNSEVSTLNNGEMDRARMSRKPRRWLQIREEIDPVWSGIPVLLCCAVSGLCDSVVFNAAGVFVSMQTGNTIFITLSAAGLPATQPALWLRALISVASFWLGCFTFGQLRWLTHPTKPKAKLPLVISFAMQAVFIFISASLAQSHVVPAFAVTSLVGSEGLDQARAEAQTIMQTELQNSSTTLIPLALLAFGFGGQIVASRALGFNEVPTNVLTSLYCDLWSDPQLFKLPVSVNPKRNRRIGGLIMFFVGGIAGAWLQRSRAGMPAPLWISGFIKLAIAISWVFWKTKAAAPVAATAGEKPKTQV